MARDTTKKTVVIIYGPPSSGKGTQAKLLSDKLGFFNFDTGVLIREILYSSQHKNNKETQREKKLNEAGKLCTPSWVFKIVSYRVKELANFGESIVFSGSPRTMEESFGYGGGVDKELDKKKSGLFGLLEKFYGRENIRIFQIIVPEREVLKRNQHRLICGFCNLPFLHLFRGAKKCFFCGGDVIRRKDDKKGIIFERLQEYKKRTLPIVHELKKQKYKIVEIDGAPLPYKIHQKLLTYFR